MKPWNEAEPSGGFPVHKNVIQPHMIHMKKLGVTLPYDSLMIPFSGNIQNLRLSFAGRLGRFDQFFAIQDLTASFQYYDRDGSRPAMFATAIGSWKKPRSEMNYI